MGWTWVVVEHAGQDDERIVHEEESRGTCQRWLRNMYSPLEVLTLGVEMLKKFDDGRLTSDY